MRVSPGTIPRASMACRSGAGSGLRVLRVSPDTTMAKSRRSPRAAGKGSVKRPAFIGHAPDLPAARQEIIEPFAHAGVEAAPAAGVFPIDSEKRPKAERNRSPSGSRSPSPVSARLTKRSAPLPIQFRTRDSPQAGRPSEDSIASILKARSGALSTSVPSRSNNTSLGRGKLKTQDDARASSARMADTVAA